VKRGKSTGIPIQPLVSLAFLALFLWGVGKAPFLPSLRLLQDTQWDPALFWPTWGLRLLSFLWIVPAGLGLLGWSRWFQKWFFKKVGTGDARLLGLALGLALFSLYVFGLAVNGIFDWLLTALFFLPPLSAGWDEWKGLNFRDRRPAPSAWMPLGAAAAVLWVSEYLSAPLAWDAVLDHFRYAREVSRLGQVPFHWVNHTGDMPKAGELILAGFWNLGGESLCRLSSALPALLTVWLFGAFVGGVGKERGSAAWIFFTCPYFLALYAFGYVEGFLAFFEVLALYCLWRALDWPHHSIWMRSAAFFFGLALSIKYTAVLGIGAAGALLLYEKGIGRNRVRVGWAPLFLFILPLFPWFLKNWLAFGDPFYPLAISFFGSPVGYSPEMERGLLSDTGLPAGAGFFHVFVTLWDSFFTASNQVNAAWTPLAAMSLPWIWGALRNKLARFLLMFSVLYFGEWLFISSSFRHAVGGALVLVLLSALAWQQAFQEKGKWAKPLFGLGVLLSLWLCLSTQLTTTAPYASALGLEDNLYRLKRHYSYSTDTFSAYHFIEAHSDPYDKVMAFAVWQTYPLERTAFVDFKWKKPIFLEWASHCQTAEQLAQKLHEEGVRYFLYQRWEAGAMSKMEKDFQLTGMPVSEYERFWQWFMEPALEGENSIVYRVRTTPSEVHHGVLAHPPEL
jgi:hypothetical protein